MENNILIMSLSNNLEKNIEKAKKSKKEYRWENKKYDLEKYEYLTKVYLEELKPNKIIVFGTDQSSWNYLYNLLNEYFYSEKENVVFLDEQKNDVEYIRKVFKERFSDKCKIFFIESKNKFDNENIVSDLVFQIEEIKKILDEQSRNQVYVDITGGLRIIFLSLISIINILKIYYSKLKLKVLYSQNDINLDYFQIIDITNVLEKLDFVDAISSFTKYGSVNKLREIIQNNNLLNKLEELYIKLQFNFKNINDTYKDLAKINVNNENEKILKERIKELKTLKNEKYHNKVKNYGIEIVNKYESDNKKYKNLKDQRNKIVHPLNKFGKYIENENDSDYKNLSKRKILIWNLGTGEFGRGYEKVLYKYIDSEGQEEIIETQYTFEPYIENYDEIYIFGLETGRWDLLTEYFKNKDIMLPNEKIKYVRIDNFENINELNQKIGNEIKIKKQEIIEIDMDITHSFRNIPFNLLTSLRLFELLNDNIVLRSIYYGERILNSECGSIYKIPILEIINLYKSIVEFKDYTKYTNFLENTKMIDEKLLNIMRKISEAYTYNEYKKIIEISKEFEKVNNKELDLINKKIYEIIEVKLIKNETYEELMKFVKNQKNSKNYALASFFLIDIYKYKIFKIDSKEKSETFYKKIEKLKNKYVDNKLKKLIDCLNKLNNIRNYAGHINIREEVNLINFSDSLEKAIKIMNKLTLKDIEKYEKEYEAIE
ncbi:TM1812 family CRISPR-associated protein [uncultured Leptotrichia sp.]|uniref:TM1812 family CRISPR-associated protein n=1 Tax=uncultured Leptotrichia sp. TaxID=159271 RepID=UPI00261CD074|nr:TM1812 family CRISPR-associated protein [uncultured Leptotrichia sp.]